MQIVGVIAAAAMALALSGCGEAQLAFQAYSAMQLIGDGIGLVSADQSPTPNVPAANK